MFKKRSKLLAELLVSGSPVTYSGPFLSLLGWILQIVNASLILIALAQREKKHIEGPDLIECSFSFQLPTDVTAETAILGAP